MQNLWPILPGYLLFILLCAMAVWSAWRLARKFFAEDSLPARVLFTLFIYLALVHLLIVVLGAFGVLNRLFYSLGIVLITSVCFFLTRKDKAPIKPWEGDLTWFEGISLFLVAGYFIWFGFKGILFPPTGVDDLEYHLPFMAKSLQTGGLLPFLTPYTGPIYYPQTIEAGYLWLVLPIHDDFLLNLGNLPFHLLLALSARQMLREWGVKRNYAALAMPFLLYSAIVSKQAWVAHVDVPLAALFLFACLMLLRYEKESRKPELVLFGLAAGLLMGTKYSALGYCGLLIAGGFGLELLLRRGMRSAVYLVLASVALMLAAGGYWYLRNLVITGTPLYPAGISLFGIELFPEGSFFFKKDLSQTTLISTFAHRPWAVERLADGLVTGVMFWTVIALPVALLAPFEKRIRTLPGRPPVPKSVYVMTALTWLTLILYLNTPYAGAWSPTSGLAVIYRGIRHGISCWSLALVCALYWFNRRWPWPDGITVKWPLKARSRKAATAVALIIAALVPALYPNRFNHYFERIDPRMDHWAPAWEWIDRKAPAGSRIAFTKMYLPYYDFGRRFDKTPRWVSRNRVNGRAYHEFEGHGLDTIFDEPRYEAWIKNLERNGIDYVHWGKRKDPDKVKPATIELEWMREHPEAFRPVVDTTYCKVFEFKKAGD
ncbi:MAG: hypothetical protein R6V10_07840 [bacterium]